MTSLVKFEKEENRNLMLDIENMQALAKKLTVTKHYSKMGEEGIFAICMTAKSIGMPEADALNGELYYVQGKVGMSYECMNKYIRKAGHSVQIKHLDDKSCTLIGKRKDTGDTAEITYDLNDAKRAGKTYDKYPKSMLFARCLSMLKRFLFPDVCTKVYEKSELEDITDDTQVSDVKLPEKDYPKSLEMIKTISSSQAIELVNFLNQCDPTIKDNILKFVLEKFNITMIDDLPANEFETYKKSFITRATDYQKKLAEAEMNNIKTEEEVK